MTIPQDYGGGGRDEISHVLALMEISQGNASVGGFLAWNNSLFCFPILKYGSEEQKRKYLFPCSKGRRSGSFALIGSALSGRNHVTGFSDGGEGWVKGRGTFFPCGFSWGILSVVSEGSKRKVFIIIDLDRTDGLKRGEIFEKGGIFFSGIAEAAFENVRVDAAELMGMENDSDFAVQSVLQEAWMAVAAIAVGIGASSMEETTNFFGNKQGRGSISQTMEWKFADMAVDLEAAKLFVLKAAWLKDQGKSYEKTAASAKVFATGAAVRLTCEGLEILGDKDPSRRPLMEERMREAKMCRVYFGTSEDAGLVVADHVIGLAGMTGF